MNNGRRLKFLIFIWVGEELWKGDLVRNLAKDVDADIDEGAFFIEFVFVHEFPEDFFVKGSKNSIIPCKVFLY